MAKRKTFDDRINDFIESLYADGTVGRWEVEKKLKQTKRLISETNRKIREQRIIDECLEEMKGRKSA